jgi:hypothetical protein
MQKREHLLLDGKSAKRCLWPGNLVCSRERLRGPHDYLDNEQIEGNGGGG